MSNISRGKGQIARYVYFSLPSPLDDLPSLVPLSPPLPSRAFCSFRRYSNLYLYTNTEKEQEYRQTAQQLEEQISHLQTAAALNVGSEEVAQQV